MLNFTNFTLKKILGIVCVFAIILGAIYTPIALAVKAASTVTVTFVDALNNTENTISGTKGESFSYPTDPVDQSGVKWFMGWYDSTKYKNEHTSGIFGEEDITLYAKWLSEFTGYTQNFESYTKDTFTVKDTNGDLSKDNRNYFFEGMTKQSDVTYNNSGYAIKMAWDSTMTKVADDPSTYNAAARYKSFDAKFYLTESLDNNVPYNVTFKYKVEKADTSVILNLYSALHHNIWASGKNNGKISLNTTTTEWQEGTLDFTVNYADTSGTAMFFYFQPAENKDYIIYIDDVVFTPLLKPNQSTVTFNTNNDENAVVLTGNRGDAINVPNVTYGDREFLGWFEDAEFTIPFEYTVYQRKNIVAYAKWGNAPITFKNPPMTDALMLRAVYTLFYKDGEGVGVNDNYALNFLHDGDATYQYSSDPEPIKFSERAANIDNAIKITKVNNGSLYKITYMRRSGKNSESDFTIKLVTADYNIWTAGRVAYEDTSITVKADQKDWVKETVYFIPNISVATADYLYFQFNSSDTTDAAYVDGFVDNVLVEEITDNVVYFETNTSMVKDFVVNGNVGDQLTIPEITNPEAPLLGWYADAELTVPFTATTIPEGFTKVYAKWGAQIMTFNNYPYEFTRRAPFTLSIKLGTNVGQNDDYALNFKYDADAKYQSQYDSAPIKFKDRFSTQDNVARIGKVDSGKVYMLTYYRKASADTNADYSINVATGSDNVWDGTYIKHTGAKIIAERKNKDWVKETVYFMPILTNVKANLLYLQFNCTDSAETCYVDAYVDNVYLEEVSGNLLFLNGNGENAKDTIFTGNIGDALTLTTPTNGRNPFLGWYADKECTIPFTGTTLQEGVTVVYAKWGAGPMAFDTYKQNFNTTSVTQFGATMRITEKEGYGYDDNHTLTLDFKGDDLYPTTDGTVSLMYSRSYLTHTAKLGTAKNSTLYKVTYLYRINKATADFKMRLMSASSNNIWTGGKIIYSTEFTPDKKKLGEWQQVSFVYATNFTKDSAGKDNNGIYFNFEIINANESTRVNVDIDNILIEEIDGSYVYFDHTEGKDAELLVGKEGDKIAHTKKPTYFGFDFTGWYIDAECTIPFTQKTFDANTKLIVFAGWKPSDTVTYSFEKYNIPHRGEIVGRVQRREAAQITFANARTGNKVIEIKRAPDYTDFCYFIVAQDETPFKIEADSDYVITVHYYIKKHAPGGAYIKIHNAYGLNFYASRTDRESAKISTSEKSGVWHSATFLISGKKLADPNANGIYFSLSGGAGGIYYFDDVVIKRVPKGSTAIIVDSDNCPGMITSYVGKPGASFASKLPKTPKYNGKYFKGYFTKNADGAYVELKPEDMKLGKESYIVYARFIDEKVVENFDTGAYSYQANVYGALKIFDFDFELYDASQPGNSKDNVTSGNFSLHRKGNSPYNEGAILLTLGNDIAADTRYTVTFKVKMGQHKHTDGALKVASCRNYAYPWDTMGDNYPVVAVADLVDGQWHEVSYTFNSVEGFASIIVPGYIEVFIDDVTFTVAEGAPLSTPITFTEYLSDTAEQALVIDILTIVDNSLSDSPMFMWIVIIGGSVIVLLAAGIVFFFIKKKKSKKA